MKVVLLGLVMISLLTAVGNSQESLPGVRRLDSYSYEEMLDDDRRHTSLTDE